jgi:hypothetical protein
MRPELEAEINRLFSASSGRYLAMKKLSILYVVLCMSLSLGFSTAAFSRGGGGMGGHHSSTTGGAFGTSPTAPGTNSAGTALSSSGTGSMEKGPTLGTGDPATDREDRKVAKIVESICRGC